MYKRTCFVFFRCVVFNNRGVSGETLLVGISTCAIYYFSFRLVEDKHVHRIKNKGLLMTVGFPICRHDSFPVEFSSSSLQPAQRRSIPRVSQTCVRWPTGNPERMLHRQCCPTQQGLRYRQILYFLIPDPQKYDLAERA